MSEINLPPFYVGQKVVALATSRNVLGCQVVKDSIYTVAGNFQCPVCKKWMIDIKEILCPWMDNLQRCCVDVPYSKYMSGRSEKFAPLLENFQSISLEKVMETETPLISVN